MKSVILINWYVVLLSFSSNGDKVEQSIKDTLHEHLQSSIWSWKLIKSRLKTVYPVAFKVDVVSTYNVTKSLQSKIKDGKYKECAAILKKNPSQKGKDGVYTIYPDGKQKKKVYCDMTTEGGGWTIFQKRVDGTTNFYRTWNEYKAGFGDPVKNFWMGNDALHLLTKKGKHELRVDLQRFNGQKGFAKYSSFAVGDERSKYKLSLSGYSGSIRDSLYFHNRMKFTTKDQDNDTKKGYNCAVPLESGWWFKDCAMTNLNGHYVKAPLRKTECITWNNWISGEALKRTAMMTRPSK
ncbi:ficolin-1-like [Saccostrea cucullata]|uniref:ficolin-1-like n=1 Tax=Saccostrea cuccullata TaxID=36930 RepID=UPI002ED05CB9